MKDRHQERCLKTKQRPQFGVTRREMVPSNREKGTFWTDLCSKYNCPTELTQQKIHLYILLVRTWPYI